MATIDDNVMIDFESASAPLRGALVAYCYRMLGSWDEAEDAAQKTYLRAWRGWEGFEQRASVRTWLYRIATNVCLNDVRDRARRAVPSGIAPPNSAGELSDELPPDRWIQPFPGENGDLRLAVVAAMQTLPPTQRAILLLRDVLDFPANDVADLLNMSVPAVKSSLQRARARIADSAPAPEDVVGPSTTEARQLLDLYVRAFETAQVHVLTAALRDDAKLELVPSQSWFAGKETCSGVLADAVSEPGDWHMRRTVANGQPAVAAYLHGQPFGIAVLDTRRDGIAGIAVFSDPALVARFAYR